MKIDLVLLGGEGNIASWPWGRILHLPFDIRKVCEEVYSVSHEDGHVLFLDSTLPTPSLNELERLIKSNVDICHAGLKLGTASISEFLDFAAPISYFNLDQSSQVEIASWKVSLKCCLVKKNIFQFPFLDATFKSIDSAALEWGFRLIWKGVTIRYTPDLLRTSDVVEIKIPREDGFLFIHKYYGRKWLAWSRLRFFLKKSSLALVKKSTSLQQKDQIRSHDIKSYAPWRTYNLTRSDFRVTIIIPTVDRYAYLFTLLKQLLQQTILPFEVFVIDQTAPERRQHIDPKDFESIGLHLIYQDTSGQCSSRNEGLQRSSGDFILFLDDDDEVKPDLIEQHLKCLNFFNADVSCGVCDEVGAGPIPKEYNLIRMSDVFPTNNGMLKREILYKSGLFDLTYNQGQKADGDLGARIYKSGAVMILNPEIRVLHHRAPSGGLRKHNVRKVTYSSSRNHITHFRLPHITELYFNRKYFTKSQQTEYVWLILLGTFSVRGGWIKKIVKFTWALLNLPVNLYRIRTRDMKAVQLIASNPSIPVLLK